MRRCWHGAFGPNMEESKKKKKKHFPTMNEFIYFKWFLGDRWIGESKLFPDVNVSMDACLSSMWPCHHLLLTGFILHLRIGSSTTTPSLCNPAKEQDERKWMGSFIFLPTLICFVLQHKNWMKSQCTDSWRIWRKTISCRWTIKKNEYCLEMVIVRWLHFYHMHGSLPIH